MMTLFQRLLKYYNINEKEYDAFIKLKEESDLPLPVDKSYFDLLERIKKSIKNDEKIIIYGDYDCDGITSTSILYLTIKKLGGSVGFFIPSRYEEGYGLASSRVEQFYEKGYKLLITVDNGISCFDSIKRAKDLGLEVIIIDHHEVGEELPPADHIFHQYYSKLTDYNISAAFLALIVSKGLLSYYDPYYVSLAGIAALSDLMPLVKGNIALVRLAIKYINEYKYPNLIKLLDNRFIDEMNLNYNLIPKINAIGRVEKGIRVNDAVRLLISDDQKKQELYVKELETCNKIRKELTSKYDKTLLKDYKNFTVYISNLPLGLGGLLANKILNNEHKNSLVLTLSEGIYTGSMRSLDGYDVYATLNKIDGLLSKGGHSHAGGLSFYEKDLDSILNQIDNELVMNCDSGLKEFIKIEKDELTMENYELIRTFSPFGTDHNEPVFEMKLRNELFKPFVNNPNHIFVQAGQTRIIYFNGADKLDSSGITRIRGRLNINTYNNRTNLQFIADRIEEKEEALIIF